MRRLGVRLGLAAKIRSPSGGPEGVSPSDSTAGFVPPLHVGASCAPTSRCLVELDTARWRALQGRAEDVALRQLCGLSDRGSLAGGHRHLEGAADTDHVYTFARSHYALASVGDRH